MLSGVAFGDPCTNDGDCVEANNACDTNCVCSNSAVRNTAGDACILSRFYNIYFLN